MVPYRLEMQAKASEAGDLYKFWGDKLYREVTGKGQKAADGQPEHPDHKGSLIVNLASKE